MASTAAMAAGRSMPAVYTIPLGPRIRPPRLLPGTKADNTNPQPDGDVPQNLVWVQGKWRNPLSNAAKDRRTVQSAQVEKALRKSTHGMHIYAYRQIRTNQVVYSLSRVMQNNKILNQLLYHGKQTKPAALRRDVWRPYFSIHFPQTAAGAEAGLDTYRLLRELSNKRQLDPSTGSLRATEEDVENARAKFDPANFEDLKENNRPEVIGLPRIGQILPPKYRAKRLMDQKESSVADVAFVLSLINDAKLSPNEKKAQAAKKLILQHKARGRRSRRRYNEIRGQQDAKDLQIESRRELINRQPGQLDLDKYAAERIALEHNGVVMSTGHVTGLENLASIEALKDATTNDPYNNSQGMKDRPKKFSAAAFKKQFIQEWNQQHQDLSPKPPFPQEQLEKEIEQKLAQDNAAIKAWRLSMQEASKRAVPVAKELNEASRHVLVLWSDLRDAMQAEKWSANVQHDWLDAKAVIKKEKSVVRQPAFIDEEGHAIEEQRQTRLVQSSSSPHVMGRDVSQKWFQSQKQLAELANEGQKAQRQNTGQREAVVKNMISYRAIVMPSAATPEVTINQALTTTDVESAKQLAREVNKAKDSLAALNDNYPAYAQALDSFDRFASLIARERDLRKQLHVIDLKHSNRQALEDEQQDIVRELREKCDADFPGYQALEQRRQDLLESMENSDTAAVHEDSVTSQLSDIEQQIESRKVDLVLAYHRNLLQEQGDESWITDNTREDQGTNKRFATGKEIDTKELNNMEVEVDMRKYDQRSLWSRVKGVFGGR